MPKAKIAARGQKTKTVTKGHKIGGRSSHVSAHSLSNVELMEKIVKPSRNRDRTKLIQVAHMRGLTIA